MRPSTTCSAAFGAAGAEVVIEEFMDGEEASFFILSDGVNCLPIGTAQDHKRVGDGDTGPNTGGMGAYSPAPVLTDAIQAQAMDEIVRRPSAEMARRGTPFQGVLLRGADDRGRQARLVEYNVRFGDPECQVLMMRLGAQALDLMHACAEGRLDQAPVNWADDHALTVVMAAKGYPGAYPERHHESAALTAARRQPHMVFHAGTANATARSSPTGGPRPERHRAGRHAWKTPATAPMR
jgi:phosphoribosylamine--glycine ligase